MLVVNHREMPAGLMVDEVLGFRRFYEGEFSADLPPTLVRCERYLAGRVPARRRGLARVQSAAPAREPGIPAGRGVLNAAPCLTLTG